MQSSDHGFAHTTDEKKLNLFSKRQFQDKNVLLKFVINISYFKKLWVVIMSHVLGADSPSVAVTCAVTS